VTEPAEPPRPLEAPGYRGPNPVPELAPLPEGLSPGLQTGTAAGSAAGGPPAGGPPAAPPAGAEPIRAPGEMPLTDHLDELRWRILKSGLAIALGFTACFVYNKELIGWILQPAYKMAILHGKLVFTAPAEYFVAALKVSFFGGIFLALPVLLYQIMAFVAPGLTPTERKWAFPMTVAGALLFTAGGAFSYYAMLPLGFKFLIGFAPQDVVSPMLTIGSVLSFSTIFLFATGAVFQLPLVMLLLSLMGVVSSAKLRKFRKIFVVVAFLVGALLSPSPDVFSQALLASALLVLYEFSIVLMRLARR
jgi:sec-independent protein translocase protein TatC